VGNTLCIGIFPVLIPSFPGAGSPPFLKIEPELLPYSLKTHSPHRFAVLPHPSPLEKHVNNALMARWRAMGSESWWHSGGGRASSLWDYRIFAAREPNPCMPTRASHPTRTRWPLSPTCPLFFAAPPTSSHSVQRCWLVTVYFRSLGAKRRLQVPRCKDVGYLR